MKSPKEEIIAMVKALEDPILSVVMKISPLERYFYLRLGKFVLLTALFNQHQQNETNSTFYCLQALKIIAEIDFNQYKNFISH